MSREYVEKRLREIAEARARSPAASAIPSAKPPTKSRESSRPSAPRRAAARTTVKKPPSAPAPPPSLPRAHVSGRFVYECKRGIVADPFNLDSAVGEYLDLLLGMLEARPPYVHSSDIPRYGALVRRFRASMYDDWPDPTPVATLPLARLHLALNEWVNNGLRDATDPLLPSFCLDTARFIEAHAYGRFFYSQREHWQLLPVLSKAERHWQSELSRDQQLKRGITSAVKGLIVRCAIPPGCRIFDLRNKVAVAESGEAFVEIQRCHLSQGFGVEYSEHLVTEQDAPMRHDIAGEFRFLANYWPPLAIGQVRRGEACPYRYEADLHRVQIPGRWITAWLDFSSTQDSGSVPLWEDVPTWAE